MKRILSLFMAAILVISLIPHAFAAEYKPTTFSIVSQKSSTIAPGVTQDIVYAKSTKDNNQLVYYLATADIARDDVSIYANYMDNQWDKWGFQFLTQQMEVAQAIHSNPASGDRYVPYYNVVAGVNADFYNMSTGQPSGAFVMEGIDINNGPRNYAFFAIRKDGTAVIGFNNADWAKYNTEDNPIVEAVGGRQHLVENGKNVADSTTDLNARTMVGITAEGKVVMAVADAPGLPFSRGACMYELAEIMLAAGCVTAINLDGGGSSTYAAKQEGSDKITLVNRPRDGSERAVTSSLMIVSTTPPSDVFDRAVLSVDNEYVTPGSAVRVMATGVSPAGTPADIPADVSWQVATPGLGSVSPDGVFTSNGTEGVAVVQMVHEGKVVGQTEINVVLPNSFAFALDTIAVPYGKTADIAFRVFYGDHEVAYKAGDIALTLSDNALGTLNGLSFTACAPSDGAPTGGSITAALTGTSLTATVPITLGRGSEVIFDFETDEQTDQFYAVENNYWCNYKVKGWVATAETGKVHDGNRSFAFQYDFSQMADYDERNANTQLEYYGPTIDITGATGVGAWVWLPDEELVTAMRLQVRYVDGSGDSHTTNTWTYAAGTGQNYDEGHWYYLYASLAGTGATKVVINTNSLIGFNHMTAYGDGKKSLNNKLTFYVDSVTVDYSSVVEDREEPVFGDAALRVSGNDSAITLTRGQIPESSSGAVSVSASVDDNRTKSNATGINAGSAEAFIDGVRVDASYQNGRISTSEISLAAGVHTVKLGISDNNGNYASVIRQFRVADTANVPMKIVPHDPSADRIPIGSVYYVDVVATDVSAIDGVEFSLDLNNISTWELAHADVDYCFDYSYTVEPIENIATLKLTRKQADDRTGEAVLASLPVRTWESETPFFFYGGNGQNPYTIGELVKATDSDYDGSPLERTIKHTIFDNPRQTLQRWTAALAWKMGVYATDITVEVDRGQITYAAGRAPDTLPVFGGKRIQVDTELYLDGIKLKAEEPTKTGWHVHTNGSPSDKASTCTEAGYTGRVFCTDCGSPVEWGDTIPATGHIWAVNSEGKLACTGGCGKLYTGEYEGKLYEDGVLVADGWVDDSYYRNGQKLTGIQKVENPNKGEDPDAEVPEELYFDFGEDGVCAGRNAYSGFFELDGAKYYAELGELKTGWFSVGEDRYHAGEDGKLHTVTAKDNRTCVVSATITYTCSCGETDESELLWFEGHTWDENYVCTVCTYRGINIANATLEIDGTHFTYTGSGIRAAHKVTYNGRELSVRSDKNGLDGYSSYSNNVEIGTATLTIEGVANFYGVLTGTFEIVPGDVKNMTAEQSMENGLTLRWDSAVKAEYYTLYYKPANAEWNLNDPTQLAGNVQGTSYTAANLAPGVYTFRATACAVRDEKVYASANWSDELTVTVSLPAQITVATVKNGTAATNPVGEALPGQTVTVTTAPNAGYDVSGVTVRDADKKAVAVTKTGENQYTFTMPTSAVTVTPSFNAQGECAYYGRTGPFDGQLYLTGLNPGWTYVCQMQKAGADGKSLGCAAIAVFQAESTMQVLDVLYCPTGYLVSLFAYPGSGAIPSFGALDIAFYEQYLPDSGPIAAMMAMQYSGMDLLPADVDGDGNDDTIAPSEGGSGEPDTTVDNEPDNSDETDDGSKSDGDETETGGGEPAPVKPAPHGDCAYLSNSGPFTAQLRLTGLIPGKTYVCQMQKANASGKDIGCAAIVVFKASGEIQELDVLPNPNGYLVSLFAYPDSGVVADSSELSVAFFGKHAR